MPLKIFLLSICLFFSHCIYAADTDLPLPPTVENERALEPEVKIIEGDDKTMYEYRLRGNLYLVKVVPTIGKPYYLVDSDGNGSLDHRSHELDPGLMVPTWVLFSW